MKRKKLSGPAVFMYSSIALTAICAAVCFALYYSGALCSSALLWAGIISFMILYHFGLRILMGNVTRYIRIDCNSLLFRQKPFEKGLYKLLRVRKWKDKVLTFDPASFDFENRTPLQLAQTMTKSELDHWINEIISVLSILFALIWGCLPACLLSALAAMLFDAQFIIVQRYNRPIVLRLMGRQDRKRGDCGA